jgi:CheY-like chemotaxis protein
MFAPFAQTIIEAEDGAEALGKALCERPSLIVTETRLRRVDGFALCSLLRKDPATQSAAIVVVTGSALQSDISRAVEAGADRVLIKPCRPEDVVDVARGLWEHRQKQADAPAGPAARGTQNDSAATAAPRTARTMKSRTFQRQFTSNPPSHPPELYCPRCDKALVYQTSHVGGVTADFPEQWDYLECTACGTYQYRHRTRKLTPVRWKP